MDVRDQRLLSQVSARQFDGYARHDDGGLRTAGDRVLACVALLAALVVSGILLGSPARRR